MIGYIARRGALAFVTVLVSVLISFVLVHLTPGSPGEVILGAGATPAQITAQNAELGWNEPLLQQLGEYLGNVAQGDLGTSIIDGHSIGSDLVARLPVTGLIAIIGTLLSAVVGTLLGLAAAVRRGRLGHAIDTTSGVALSLPPFWIAVLFVYVISIKWGLLPATGYTAPDQSFTGWLQSIALPVLALSVASGAVVARTARVALMDVLEQPHIQMFRSIGTPPHRVLLRALRAASVPVASVVGVQFIALFSGSIIIENLFALPGLGEAASVAITSHDFPAVEGVVIVAALVVVLMNLVLDVAVGALDPRVRATR